MALVKIRLPDPLQTPDSRPHPRLQRTMTEWATLHGPRHVRDGQRTFHGVEPVGIELHNIYSVLEDGPGDVPDGSNLGAALARTVQCNKRRVWYAAFRVTLPQGGDTAGREQRDMADMVYPTGSRKD